MTSAPYPANLEEIKTEKSMHTPSNANRTSFKIN
jgi:hypothetical protein